MPVVLPDNEDNQKQSSKRKEERIGANFGYNTLLSISFKLDSVKSIYEATESSIVCLILGEWNTLQKQGLTQSG